MENQENGMWIKVRDKAVRVLGAEIREARDVGVMEAAGKWAPEKQNEGGEGKV